MRDLNEIECFVKAVSRRSPRLGTTAWSRSLRVATLFQMSTPGSGRTLTCAAYEVETGLELRVSYGDDVMRTELFRGVDRDERVAEAADAWRLALLQKGFTEQLS
jgi:hypothetical protein